MCTNVRPCMAGARDTGRASPMTQALSNNCLFHEASLFFGGVFTCIFQVLWTCLDQQLPKFSFHYNVSLKEGNLLPGDIWFGTTSLPGCGCYDSCSWFGKSSSSQSSANTALAYLVFSGKSKYGPVFSLLIFSCLCLLLFGINDVKADLGCQYFNSRFQKKYPHLSQWQI